MIKSMTGYGIASQESENLKIHVEVKTLNSKFLDLNLRIPKSLNDKELEIRKIISDKLERGKVALSLEYVDATARPSKLAIDTPLFLAYYNELKNLAQEVNADTSDIFKLALQSPEVMLSENQLEDEGIHWELLKEKINEALAACDNFRITEGATLQAQLESSIREIGNMLEKIIEQDPLRIQNIRNRIKQNIEELSLKGTADENRLEQEIIYYIEKLDISEEKVRLKSHLDYFLEVMNMPTSQGKKLGFISQEIGREINTIGSKANDALIQKYVVGMKEELEKIKEQLLNIV